MKKRIVINKPKSIQCQLCQKEISLYSLSSHLKFAHKTTADQYAQTYGEFRKPKRAVPIRNVNVITCGLCGQSIPSVGMFTHLRDTHSTTPDQYVTQFGEYRPSKLRAIEYRQRLSLVNEEEKQTCLICGQQFASGPLLGGHVKRDHLMSKRDYILNHVFKGVHPVCKCGCGRKVKILKYHPYKVDYVTGHNSWGENNGMFGKRHSAETRKKMSVAAVKRVDSDTGIKTDTTIELAFKSLLDKLGVEYRHPYDVDLGYRMASIDFFLAERNLLVEIDGEYWHPQTTQSLTFHVMPSVLSDKQKEVLPNLIRIRENELLPFIDLVSSKEDLFSGLVSRFQKKKYFNDVLHDQVIVSKDYFRTCLERKNRSYLEENSWMLVKFLRLFVPDFPYPELKENLFDVMEKISRSNLTKIYNPETNSFSNNTSTVGHNWLKHHFHSFWDSKFKGSLSPIEAWADEPLLTRIINYRIGLNNSGEVFDFTINQVLRGLAANRITVSFFKPTLAAAIYRHYLGDSNLKPTVFDPCCGFGGRLLGFKSVYPNGKYIGCEPNRKTYDELVSMKTLAGWGDDVEIHNCRVEDFVPSDGWVDLMFTSIPYFETETYGDPHKQYSSFHEWKTTFISALERLADRSGKVSLSRINVPSELANRLNWVNVSAYISSNRSHFENKGLGQKKELIVSLG